MIRSARSRPTMSLAAVPERPLGGLVDLDDPAAGVHRDDAVERGVEDRALARLALAQAVLRPPALHALPDAAAEARHRLEQGVVGVAALGGEELGGADHAGGAADREAERRPQAGPRGALAAREVRVGAHVDDPRRLTALPHPSRQPLAGRQPHAPADQLERRRPLPRLDAAQRAAVAAPTARRRPSRATRRSRRGSAGRRSPRRRPRRGRARRHAPFAGAPWRCGAACPRSWLGAIPTANLVRSP